jgi:hypothetical protein
MKNIFNRRPQLPKSVGDNVTISDTGKKSYTKIPSMKTAIQGNPTIDKSKAYSVDISDTGKKSYTEIAPINPDKIKQRKSNINWLAGMAAAGVAAAAMSTPSNKPETNKLLTDDARPSNNLVVPSNTVNKSEELLRRTPVPSNNTPLKDKVIPDIKSGEKPFPQASPYIKEQQEQMDGTGPSNNPKK